MHRKTFCLAITGASGFCYAVKLLKHLLAQSCEVHCLVSEAAREVARLEEGVILPQGADALKQSLLQLCGISTDVPLFCYDKTDWLSPVASGSFPMDGMIICPCSTGTLAAVATGQSNDLVERAATVCLKESRSLILVPREMPLSAIMLEQMYKLATLGVKILPASPGFYHQPKTLDDLTDFVVARILAQAGLPQTLITPWGKDERID